MSSCDKDDNTVPKKENEQTKEEEKPAETFEFDKAYAFGELPYLKHGDVKGADEFERNLAQRQKQTFPKLGEVYWGNAPKFFKGAKYTDDVIYGMMEIPIVKIDAEFTKMMTDAGFADYGTTVISDGNGNVAPCHIYWNAKLKIKALAYDAKHKDIKSIRSIVEFKIDENEPQTSQGDEPEETVILTDVTDFPDVKVLNEKYESLPKQQLIEMENALGLRYYDEEGSDEGKAEFRTKKEYEAYSNLNACMYFYEASEKAISFIALSCPVVKKVEDLDRKELNQWFAANGYTFVKKQKKSNAPGAIYANSAAGVKAHIYLKANGNCFIEISK
ncbi:hypothetical protein JCM15124A_17300 [Prevotella falsenii]